MTSTFSQKVLVEWNRTERPFPRSRCVHELFEEQVAQRPSAPAVVCDGQVLSYAELNSRANQLAAWLRKRGVGPGVLVGISLERSLELVIGLYGTLKAGGAYVPMDPSYPADRLAYMLESSKANLVLTQKCIAERWRVPGVTTLCLDTDWDKVAQESTENPAALARPSDLIYVIFTSGSTGRPKGAGVFHRGFMNLVQWFIDEFSFDSNDRALVISSPSFDLTQKNFYAPLLRGGQLHLLPGSLYDPGRIRQIIQTAGITRINCTPSAFYPLIEQGGEERFASLASLRTAFLGGEPISTSRLRPWFQAPSCVAEVANTYGPTECSDICAFYRLNRQNLADYDFVPTGRPVYNVQLVIVNEAMKPCEPGQPGELCVAGEGVGAGYINDAELTATKFVKNPFPEIPSARLYRTGDLARYLENGLIEFLGRLDHQVKLRGLRIELPEIERALEQHPAVREAAVILQGSPEEPALQRLAAFIVPKEQPILAPADLGPFLKNRLPEYMVPSQFVALDRFPLSPNGKVDRRKLAEEHARKTEKPANVSTALDGQQSPLEKTILGIWCQVLALPKVGLDQNFFDVGGNSLSLTEVHSRLQFALGRPLPITDLFAHPTIRKLAQHLNASVNGSTGPVNGQQTRARLQQAAFMRARRPLSSV